MDIKYQNQQQATPLIHVPTARQDGLEEEKKKKLFCTQQVRTAKGRHKSIKGVKANKLGIILIHVLSTTFRSFAILVDPRRDLISSLLLRCR